MTYFPLHQTTCFFIPLVAPCKPLLIVFVIIYVLSGPIIGYTNYDMYLKGIEFLSAVIGAGCYWIGSNKK